MKTVKEFIDQIVSYIVDENVPFEIKEEPAEDLTIYTIFVPEQEMGKLIGKGGKVISSIRTLCRLKAIKNQKRVLIKVDKISSE